MTPLSERPAVIRARSALFHATSAAVVVLFAPLLVLTLLPMRYGWAALSAFVAVEAALLRVICGQKVRVTGLENVPPGPCLFACRHEAAWETLYLPRLLDNPAVVLKREILSWPLAGPVARMLGHIGVDRGGDLDAARQAFGQARDAARAGRSVLIFPSGTRDPAGRDRVQSGVAVLYRQMGVPCVPVTLNSGDLWPHGSWLRKPGVIEVRFAPALAPGLKTRDFLARLERELAEGARP